MNDPAILYKQALEYERLSQIKQAMSAYSKIICIDPDAKDALHGYQRCIELLPDAAQAYNQLGISFARANRHQTADKCFERAIELNPNLAFAYNNRGLLQKSLGNYSTATKLYEQAVKLDPKYANAHWNMALTLLLTGNFTRGWQEFTWRSQAKLDAILDSQKQNKTLWNGSPFRNKQLLIRYEQGFGDNIQCIRYIPEVKKLGGTVIVETHSLLMDLFKQIPEIDVLTEASADGTAQVEYDISAFIMDLPGIFKTTLNNIPADIPYLYADIEKTNLWQKNLHENSFKIGIIWAGSPKHTNDMNRSCSLALFEPLSQIPGIKLFSLQKGKAADQLTQINWPVKNLAPKLYDFTDTAALIESLDLIISVDTACLHLAGALGKPAWGIIPFVPDWRWLTERDSSPWYPSIRLFRQPQDHNWRVVFNQIAQQLKTLLFKNI